MIPKEIREKIEQKLKIDKEIKEWLSENSCVQYGDLMLCCPTCKHGVVPIPTYHGNRYYPRCPFCGQLLK